MPGLSRLAPVALLIVLTGCSAGDSPAAPTSLTPAPAPSASTTPTPSPVRTAATNPKLRKELLTMLAADQKSRQDPSGAGVGDDQVRTERLGEIVAEHGWPGRTLVGDDGATAAWTIAQHSDLDPDFQRRLLGLMTQAAAAGEASRGELAYLTDRVAANAGQPQTYGTQMGCDNGKPKLAAMIDPGRVDERRAAAGLPPLADNLIELEQVCAQPG